MTCHTPTPSVVVPDNYVRSVITAQCYRSTYAASASSCTVTITKQKLRIGQDELEAAMETP